MKNGLAKRKIFEGSIIDKISEVKALLICRPDLRVCNRKCLPYSGTDMDGRPSSDKGRKRRLLAVGRAVPLSSD
jgi:hypothetical protein